ncbi:MAG: hypothetical protein GY679_04210, partial [Mycoplasma sp.]|nr:hypothetical protein [Mycoplasma sp.]
MSAYPSEWGESDDLRPTDCIFTTQRSGAWIKDRWEEQYKRLYKGEHYGTEDLYTVLEYYDAEQFTTLVLGRPPEGSHGGYDRAPVPETGQVVTLDSIANRTGVCPVVMPKRINLNGPRGQFDGILGMYQTEAMLMALSVQATFKGIFQETWIVDSPNERADVEDIPNPMTGQPGIIHGGQIQRFGVDPQFQTNQAMDRLEYGQRSTASIPAEYGGYGGTNVRTGKRGAQVMGAAVDYPIQEHQEILALSMQEENRIAIAIDREYFGGESKSFYVSWGKNRGLLEYTPNDIFDTDETQVSYAYAGADENSLMILTGQRVGMGTLSKESAMEVDPMITDVEHEQDRITSEALEAAFLSKVQTDAANPESPMTGGDIALLRRLVLTDRKDLDEAWDEVQAAIQQRQQAQMEAMAEQAQGAVPGPEAMPGLAAEGMASIPSPEDSMPGAANLGNLMGRLRQPQMQLRGERQGGVRQGTPTWPLHDSGVRTWLSCHHRPLGGHSDAEPPGRRQESGSEHDSHGPLSDRRTRSRLELEPRRGTALRQEQALMGRALRPVEVHGSSGVRRVDTQGGNGVDDVGREDVF